MKLRCKLFSSILLVTLISILGGCVKQPNSSCSVDYDCQLTSPLGGGDNTCPPCDQTDPKWECLMAEEIEQLDGSEEPQVLCEACHPDEAVIVECQCANGECIKIKK